MNFDIDFEKAVRILSKYMPDVKELVKPTLFHSLRVGVKLYEEGYSREVCIAGALHDMLEDSAYTVEEMRNEFGDEVTNLVLANTKNESLQSPEKIIDELLERSSNHSKEASIIKAADIIDNLKYVRKMPDLERIKKVEGWGASFLDKINGKYYDKIFDELEKNLKNII